MSRAAFKNNFCENALKIQRKMSVIVFSFIKLHAFKSDLDINPKLFK